MIFVFLFDILSLECAYRRSEDSIFALVRKGRTIRKLIGGVGGGGRAGEEQKKKFAQGKIK